MFGHPYTPLRVSECIISTVVTLMKVIVTLTAIAQETLDADQTTVVMDGLPMLIVALIKFF